MLICWGFLSASEVRFCCRIWWQMEFPLWNNAALPSTVSRQDARPWAHALIHTRGWRGCRNTRGGHCVQTLSGGTSFKSGPILSSLSLGAYHNLWAEKGIFWKWSVLEQCWARGCCEGQALVPTEPGSCIFHQLIKKKKNASLEDLTMIAKLFFKLLADRAFSINKWSYIAA